MKDNPLESQDAYQKYVDEKTPDSPILKNCFNAFWVGGLICAIGQIIFECVKSKGVDETMCYTIVSMSLVFISSFLTALNLFNRIGKFARCRFSYTNHWFCKFYCFTSYGI